MVKKGVVKSGEPVCSKCFFRLLIIALGIFILQAIFVFTPLLHFSMRVHNIVGNIFIVSLSILALISAILIYRKVSSNFPREKKAKLFLIISIFLIFIGDLLWLVSEIFFGSSMPIGSFPDFAWLSAYIFLIISLLYYISISFRPSWISSTLIVVISLLVGGLVLGMDVAEDLEEGSFNFAHMIQDSYILFDIIVLFLVIYLVWPIFSAGFRFYSMWLFLGIGIITRAIYDQIFANMSQNGTYFTGHPIDLIYVLFYIFIIASFYFKSKYLVVKL